MPSANPKPRTMYDKVFDEHIVDEREDGTILLYIGKLAQIIMIMMHPKVHGRQAPSP